MKCVLCQFEHKDLKRFSDHVRTTHGLSSEQYTIEHVHGGVRPVCAACNNPVRYVSFSFKKYCKDHARLAMSEAGTVGGKADAWNKGKTKETDSRIAALANGMLGQNNPFYGHSHTPETIKKISESKTLDKVSLEQRIIERRAEFELVTPIEEYSSRQKQYLQFKCLKCGTIQPKTLQAFERGSRCYRCFPESKSNWELEVYDYVKLLATDAETGNRSVLAPREIDVYVPSKKFGIECHGLYWHSEGSARAEFDKRSHLNKLELAERNGITLCQFFYDEWRDKQKICKSIIAHKIGASNIRIGARELEVVDLSVQQQRSFFEESHIAGYTASRFVVGLVSNTGAVIAALGLRKPRQISKYANALEVSRCAFAVGHNVPGGLQRLIEHASTRARANGATELMTYVDRRFGDGHGYNACGFEVVGKTSVNYWYTDNALRYDRFKFRASQGTSERDVAREAGVSRIYGCGSLVLKKVLCA